MPEILNDVDRKHLTLLEARVDQGLSGAADGFAALLEIQRHGYYRAFEPVNAAGEAERFLAYCGRRWPRHVRTIRRQLVRAEVAEAVTRPQVSEDGPKSDLGQSATPRVPEPNERQARELNRLTGRPEAQREVWRAVVARAKASEQKVTAKVVREGVDQYLRATAPDDPSVEEIRAGQEETKRQSVLMAEREAVSRAVKGLRKIADSLRLCRGTAARAILAAVDAALLVAEEHAG